ncbi:MAG: lamin tail domain-containing protein [Chloroflexota bacterium]
MESPDVQGVALECVFYDGRVPYTEADEYVQIVNLGQDSVDLEGWKLQDAADGSPTFVFPPHVVESGEAIRVYTNQVHEEWGRFSFGSGTAVWNNSNPDTASLVSAEGQVVSEASYPPGCPG